MKKIIVLLLAFILLAGCSNTITDNTPKTVHKCTSTSEEGNPIWTTVTTLIESDENGIITKIEDVAVLSENVPERKESLIEQYAAHVVEQQLIGVDCSYEFSENDTVFTLTTVMDLSKVDEDYLENDSIFAFINSREAERFIEIAEDSGFTCSID